MRKDTNVENSKLQTQMSKTNKRYILHLKSEEAESLKLVEELINRCNDKDNGREVSFKEVALHALKKLTDKDIEKIKEASLSHWDILEAEHKKYIKKSGQNIDLSQFLVMKLKLQ